MRVAAVIPARMHSTRLPGKPLLRIAGVPMIVRVLDRARNCPELGRVVVATDSEEIVAVVRQAGGEAWMTSVRHATGSDRVAEVASRLSEEYVLNLQGDEPLLPQSTVRALVGHVARRPLLTVATARVPLLSESDVTNPNIVKVVSDLKGRALYFSRYPLPYRRREPLGITRSGDRERVLQGYFKHVGLYLYRREFLLEFVRLPHTPLEEAESLEQLRILEHGYPIDVVDVSEDSVSVDTPEDLAEVEAILAEQCGRTAV